jgi:predicted kinase
VFRSPDWRERCEAVLHEFQLEIPLFHSESYRSERGIWANDRTGNESSFPILSLSSGVMRPDAEHCSSRNEVAAMASDVGIRKCSVR